MAMAVVFFGAHRFGKYLPQNQNSDVIESSDAISLPLKGSVTLLTLYVLIRLIPKEYFLMLISFCIHTLGVFTLITFMSSYLKPRILVGIFSLTIGILSFWWGNWIANNILASILGIVSIESLVCDNFFTSFILLIGLFFYDIFWVFGTDAMITVATGIDGPIKLVFPATIFGDHTKKSLLGLGDLVIPGLFIAQLLVFSRDFVKRGNLYFNIGMIAYFISLLNTMIVMVYFQHGQPALLFIVPWLLVTFCLSVWYNGDTDAALRFTVTKLYLEGKDESKTNGLISEEDSIDNPHAKCKNFSMENLEKKSDLMMNGEKLKKNN
ncbi:unnamed protein product [Phytomonas sp. Hart1]|nr:unnamed protein product [Phytomonas sp. Hart1]|eukprot:CCW67405.1 unnamed protein product [Phytomonas sp. isolate Hart1]